MIDSQKPYQALVNEVNQLISLPAACFKILELSKDENSTARDIEKELKTDPGIATQVLRMANSAFYSMQKNIDTLSRAVSIIGMRRISNIVLAVSAIKSFQVFKNDIVTLENFWSHSISTAVISARLAKHCGHKENESFFVSGLLHDIGQLILFNKRPEEVKQALNLMQDDIEYQDIYVYEQQILGFDHMQIGAAIAQKWQLPDNLIECIKFHHEPTSAIKCPFDVAIIHIANMLANLTELNSSDIDDAPPINPICWKITNLNPEICIQLLEECREEYDNTQAALLAA